MEDFLNSLTMAEIGRFEDLTGFDLSQAGDNSTGDMLNAVATLALDRLGLPDAPTGTLNQMEVSELCEAAAGLTPRHPKEITAILAKVRKSPKDAQES